MTDANYPTIITGKLALEGLRLAVADRGEDYVDPLSLDGFTCEYVIEDENGKVDCACIVGTALCKLGVPAEDMVGVMGDIDDVVQPWEGDSSGTLPVELTRASLEIFREAQLIQDTQGTWGRALLNAEFRAKDQFTAKDLESTDPVDFEGDDND